MAKINIEGTHLRWFVIGALVKHATESRGGDLRGVKYEEGKLTLDTGGGQFTYLVDDTCNRVHKYLTTDGHEGVGGGASDLQCQIALNARTAFGVKSGDQVEIFW